MKNILVNVGNKSGWISKFKKFTLNIDKYIGTCNKDYCYKKNYKNLDINKYDLLISLGIDDEYDKINLYDKFLKNGKRVIVFGSGLFFRNNSLDNMCVFVDGTHFTEFGHKFCNFDFDNKRMGKFFINGYEIKDERTSGSDIVISHYNTPTWDGKSKELIYSNIYKYSQQFKNTCNIIVRLQPTKQYSKKYIKNLTRMGFQVITNTSLTIDNFKDSLSNAKMFLSYGGKSPSKAVINGIKVITFSNNMADMVSNNIANINSTCFDRGKWLKWLSYNHWYYNEIREGMLWKHLSNMEII